MDETIKLRIITNILWRIYESSQYKNLNSINE